MTTDTFRTTFYLLLPSLVSISFVNALGTTVTKSASQITDGTTTIPRDDSWSDYEWWAEYLPEGTTLNVVLQ